MLVGATLHSQFAFDAKLPGATFAAKSLVIPLPNWTSLVVEWLPTSFGRKSQTRLGLYSPLKERCED